MVCDLAPAAASWPSRQPRAATRVCHWRGATCPVTPGGFLAGAGGRGVGEVVCVAFSPSVWKQPRMSQVVSNTGPGSSTKALPAPFTHATRLLAGQLADGLAGANDVSPTTATNHAAGNGAGPLLLQAAVWSPSSHTGASHLREACCRLGAPVVLVMTSGTAQTPCSANGAWTSGLPARRASGGCRGSRHSQDHGQGKTPLGRVTLAGVTEAASQL